MADPQYRGPHLTRRKQWQAHIDHTGAVPCGCTGQCRRHHGPCPTLIHPGDPWHLGHTTPHIHGGTSTDATPWCPTCNTTDGAHLTNTRRTGHSQNW